MSGHPSEASVFLSEASVVEFRSRIRGETLGPSDQGYERSRRVFNAMIDRRPALIVRCAGTSDVVQGVNFARENGWRFQ